MDRCAESDSTKCEPRGQSKIARDRSPQAIDPGSAFERARRTSLNDQPLARGPRASRACGGFRDFPWADTLEGIGQTLAGGRRSRCRRMLATNRPEALSRTRPRLAPVAQGIEQRFPKP